MTDDLKERFRILDALDFPHDAGPPRAGSVRLTAADTRARSVATAVFAFALGAVAIGFVIRAFEGGADRPPARSNPGGEMPTGPGTCDHGPWIEHCPEADWARTVVDVAGLEIVDEEAVLVVGAPGTGEFSFWAMDPSLHAQVQPLSEVVAAEPWSVTTTVDGVPVYRLRARDRVWLWASHGLNVFVDGQPPLAAPSREDIIALVRASGSVPYTSTTPPPGARIPDLVGLTDQQAMRALDQLGLTWVVAYRAVEDIGRWHVASVDPPAGTGVAPGSTVRVVVATDVTPLPADATDALDCDTRHRESFGGPRVRVLPGGSAYITGNLPGIARDDEVVQVTFRNSEWEGFWHVVREGSVVAVVDFGSLDGVACQGSGVAGA